MLQRNRANTLFLLPNVNSYTIPCWSPKCSIQFHRPSHWFVGSNTPALAMSRHGLYQPAQGSELKMLRSHKQTKISPSGEQLKSWVGRCQNCFPACPAERRKPCARGQTDWPLCTWDTGTQDRTMPELLGSSAFPRCSLAPKTSTITLHTSPLPGKVAWAQSRYRRGRNNSFWHWWAVAFYLVPLTGTQEIIILRVIPSAFCSFFV